MQPPMNFWRLKTSDLSRCSVPWKPRTNILVLLLFWKRWLGLPSGVVSGHPGCTAHIFRDDDSFLARSAEGLFRWVQFLRLQESPGKVQLTPTSPLASGFVRPDRVTAEFTILGTPAVVIYGWVTRFLPWPWDVFGPSGRLSVGCTVWRKTLRGIVWRVLFVLSGVASSLLSSSSRPGLKCGCMDTCSSGVMYYKCKKADSFP